MFAAVAVSGGAPGAFPEVWGQPIPADHAAQMVESRQIFREHVAPAFKAHCLKCHGGASTVKGDFDLSTREKLLASGFVEARSADSHLLAVIRHELEPHMPLKAAPLPAETIARIARWIDLGAAYDRDLAGATVAGEMKVGPEDRKFWSFQPLNRGPVPQPAAADWVRTDIDRFILARLQEARIPPNDDADRRTLIRRATLDLLGLPPSFEEVEAFVNDRDPEAYEKLIDRLLESPHYGERWARHWMDVARFAESHGYEQDYDRPHAYHYRDFLIRAFNQDLPYDTFVQWQLAGDELAPDEPLALTATGFLGAGVFPTQLTEAEFESARYDELDDMATTTGVAFLGLSVGCARCHDHKFDPIPSRDYYRLVATFTKTIRSELELELAPEANQRRRAAHQERLAELARQQKRYEEQSLDADFRRWLAAVDLDAAQSAQGKPEDGADKTGDKPAGQTALSAAWSAAPMNVVSSAGTRFELLDDGSLLSTGAAPAKEILTLTAANPGPLTGVRAVRLETLTHPSLPRGGPGRADNGNFALGDMAIRIVSDAAEGAEAPRSIPLSKARATHQQNAGSLSVAASIDDDRVSGWAVDQGGIGKDQAAVFEAATAFDVPAGHRLQLVLTLEHPNSKHTIGRLRVSLTSEAGAPAEVGAPGWPAELRAAVAAARETGDASSESWRRALDWYRDRVSPLAALRREEEQLRAAGPQVEKSTVQVSSEGLPHLKHHADGRGYPHFYPQTHFLRRGDVHQKQGVVAPGFLQVLTPVEAAGDSVSADSLSRWQTPPPEGWTRTSFARAGLARWLTDAEAGAGQLAARVIVNRLWQHHFGRGIVATPNDFGLQGERPTHPLLLDHLAADLIDGGWKLKRMHRSIMLSSVYRQSTLASAGHRKSDPENHLWWRREPRRLEAEAIRDSLLVVSGQLDATLYGPGTLDENMRRRSVYFFIKRSQLIPGMMLFDWPEHLVSIGSRSSTTIAPQALAFMNSPQGRRAAEALAARVGAELGAGKRPEERLEERPEERPEERLEEPPGEREAERVRQTYRRGLSRNCTARELELGVAFLKAQGEAYRMEGKPNAEALAEVDLCQAVLGMNEFIYVD